VQDRDIVTTNANSIYYVLYRMALFPVTFSYPKYTNHPNFRHKPALYENGYTDPACFWHRGFPWPILHCVRKELGYLQTYGYFPLELLPKFRT